MKKIIMLIVMLCSNQVWAADLNSTALEGAWEIISMAGMADEEGDMWEFENGMFYQNLGGRRISPDKYTVIGKVIDLDGYKIEVLEFTGSSMKADMAGFIYELKKK